MIVHFAQLCLQILVGLTGPVERPSQTEGKTQNQRISHEKWNLV
jgi:hypothetical protein